MGRRFRYPRRRTTSWFVGRSMLYENLYNLPKKQTPLHRAIAPESVGTKELQRYVLYFFSPPLTSEHQTSLH